MPPRARWAGRHDRDGRVLLLGVGHDADTTIHLAESMASVPYQVPKHCTALEAGRAVRVEYTENDHCCQRFALVDEWLRASGLQREGRVGHAAARLVASRDIAAGGRQRPAMTLIFLHPAGFLAAPNATWRGDTDRFHRRQQHAEPTRRLSQLEDRRPLPAGRVGSSATRSAVHAARRAIRAVSSARWSRERRSDGDGGPDRCWKRTRWARRAGRTRSGPRSGSQVRSGH